MPLCCVLSVLYLIAVFDSVYLFVFVLNDTKQSRSTLLSAVFYISRFRLNYTAGVKTLIYSNGK